MNLFKMIGAAIAALIGFFLYNKGKDSEKLKQKENENEKLHNTIENIRDARVDEQKIEDSNIDDLRSELYKNSTKNSTK